MGICSIYDSGTLNHYRSVNSTRFCSRRAAIQPVAPAQILNLTHAHHVNLLIYCLKIHASRHAQAEKSAMVRSVYVLADNTVTVRSVKTATKTAQFLHAVDQMNVLNVISHTLG